MKGGALVGLVVGRAIVVPADGTSSQPVRLERGRVYEVRVSPARETVDDVTTIREAPVCIVAGDVGAALEMPQGHPITPSSPLRIWADFETVAFQQPFSSTTPAPWGAVFVTVSEVRE